jgi:hypothetical protein
MRLSPKPGDLVIVDPVMDRRGLYLELRDVLNKHMYANPRVVLDPDDLIVVLKVDGRDSLVVASCGIGWIESDTLHVVSSYSKLKLSA